MVYNHKVAQLYVKDYLSATKSGQYYFTVNNEEFGKAVLGGNVTDLKNFGDKLIITVSDSTGCIGCMLPKDRNKLSKTITSDYAKLRKPECLLSKATGIVTASSKKLLDRTHCENLKPGQFVRVVGKVRFTESFGNYIFVDHIEKIQSIDEQIAHFNSTSASVLNSKMCPVKPLP